MQAWDSLGLVLGLVEKQKNCAGFWVIWTIDKRVVMWMEDFSVVFDYAGSAGIFRISGLCFLYSDDSYGNLAISADMIIPCNLP